MKQCEERLWRSGGTRQCERVVAIRTWTDETGREHAGCPYHIAGLQHRYPPTEPNVAAALLAERAAHDDHDFVADCRLCQVELDGAFRAQFGYPSRATESELRLMAGDR